MDFARVDIGIYAWIGLGVLGAAAIFLIHICDEGNEELLAIVVCCLVGGGIAIYFREPIMSVDWMKVSSVMLGMAVLVCTSFFVFIAFDSIRNPRPVRVRNKSTGTSTQGVGVDGKIRARGILYHGTPYFDWAFDILTRERVKLGNSMGFYVTSDFMVAIGYARQRGAVVELKVCDFKELVGVDGTVFRVDYSNDIRGQYRPLRGLKPLRILDVHKNEVYPFKKAA